MQGGPVLRLWLASLVAIVPMLGRAQTAQDPDALARALQERYRRVRDFSADFVQTYRGGFLATETRERGTVSIKKPGRMRWIYTDPERKEFVSDGSKIYSYVPEDEQVLVYDVPREDTATTPDLFLSGKGDIVTDFEAALADGPIENTTALKLTPVREEPAYEYLIVALDPATLQIRALTTRDRQGGESTIRFDNLRENTGISDDYFTFHIPRGVDVIVDGLN